MEISGVQLLPKLESHLADYDAHIVPGAGFLSSGCYVDRHWSFCVAIAQLS